MTFSTSTQTYSDHEVHRKLTNLIIIDDYQLQRVGLRTFFKHYEHIHVVGEADSGEQGLQLVRRLHPNVVLLDLGLPGMNGIEVAQSIKSMDKQIKVIVLTSHDNEEDVLAALGAGADAYCLKDISPDKLLEVIDTVQEGGGWLDPKIAAVAQKLYSSKSPAMTTTERTESSDMRDSLTPREKEVLRLLVEGKSNTEIADELIVSVHTAKAHVCNILQKLYVNHRIQAAVKAVREGLV